MPRMTLDSHADFPAATHLRQSSSRADTTRASDVSMPFGAACGCGNSRRESSVPPGAAARRRRDRSLPEHAKIRGSPLSSPRVARSIAETRVSPSTPRRLNSGTEAPLLFDSLCKLDDFEIGELIGVDRTMRYRLAREVSAERALHERSARFARDIRAEIIEIVQFIDRARRR